MFYFFEMRRSNKDKDEDEDGFRDSWRILIAILMKFQN